jgi:histidinol dehydrogenase
MHAIRKVWIAIPFAAAVLGCSLPASAQQSGLVNVDLRNAKILDNVANHLNVNVSNVPVTVQVPIDVAANVCGVAVDLLSQAYKSGSANCYAQGTSKALDKQVQRVINSQQ